MLKGYKNDCLVNQIVNLVKQLDVEDLAKLLDYFDYILEKKVNDGD
ncbi:MAG TPA: hypothetical protein GX708_01050 [Gallicola sp.]|nr:hypothetical protein [Gallicola sp.]